MDLKEQAKAILDRISGVTARTTSGGLLIEAGDFKLYVAKWSDRWIFQEERSSPPSRAAHFDLRRQVHYVLNYGHV